QGPLNMLVKISQERDEPLFPALIYSSGIIIPYGIVMNLMESEEEGEKSPCRAPSDDVTVGRAEGGREEKPTSRDGKSPSSEKEEESGAKLGLGDFVFYSILIGKATKDSGDWNTILACYVAILVGLAATCILLAVLKKALPALPISLALGLIFYFSTNFLIAPFTNQLIINQLTY
ncbi:hypothetical protein PMAYCL1PPCAC_02972, partial [Pristionchus mayeri]